MNLFRELEMHAQALLEAVEGDKKFFVSILHYVRELASVASGKSGPPERAELRAIMSRIEEFFRQWRPSGGLYIPPRQTSDLDPTVRELNRIVDQMVALSDEEYVKNAPAAIGLPPGTPIAQRQPCVFIGHGRSRLWARLKMFLQDDLNVATVTYESESRTGESITPILEKMLDQATFAVLILTAEDEVAEEKKRARQNVVHEAGLFQGRLGFKRAVLLVQDGLETFTNVDGLQHIRFTGDNIEQSFYDLQRVLKREGQITP